jgi:hypothetical protein
MGDCMLLSQHLTYCACEARASMTRPMSRPMYRMKMRSQIRLAVLAGAVWLPTFAAAQVPDEPAPSESATEPERIDREPGPSDVAETDEGATVIVADVHNTVRESEIDKSDRAPLPWRASVSWNQGYAMAGFVRSTQQTHNPTYIWDFLFSVGYSFNRDLVLSAMQPMLIELTDSDSTTSRQQFMIDDTALDLAYTFLRSEPRPAQALKLAVSGRLLFPTSLASQAAGTVVGTRAAISGSYAFEQILHGLLTRSELRYTHRWNRYATPTAEEPYPCTDASGKTVDCEELGGISNLTNAVVFAVGGDLGFAKDWTLSADITLGWGRGDPFEDTSVGTETGEVEVPDTSQTHWRNTYSLDFAVGYEFTRWFSLSASISNGSSQRAPNGDLRAPFSPYDTSVGLLMVFSVDELYASSQKHGGA